MADYDYLDCHNDDGTVVGQKTTSKVAFWGITPVDQPTTLTTALTTISYVSASTLDYVIQSCTCTQTAVGFANTSEAQTVLMVVQNLQIRLGQTEAVLVEAGLIAGGTAVSTPTSYDYLGKGSDDGSILGYTTTDKIGFWGVTPCDQPAALTTVGMTSITLTATAADVYSTADIAIMVTGDDTAFGFRTHNEGTTVLMVINQLQTRMNEVETNLTEVGILATTTAGISITTSAGLNFLDKGSDDGTIIVATATAKFGFWGTTPVDQPAALTAKLATITCTAAAVPDYAIETLVSGSAAFKFGGAASGYLYSTNFLLAVKNLQTRMDELEARLEEVGLIAAN